METRNLAVALTEVAWELTGRCSHCKCDTWLDHEDTELGRGFVTVNEVWLDDGIKPLGQLASSENVHCEECELECAHCDERIAPGEGFEVNDDLHTYCERCAREYTDWLEIEAWVGDNTTTSIDCYDGNRLKLVACRKAQVPDALRAMMRLDSSKPVRQIQLETVGACKTIAHTHGRLSDAQVFRVVHDHVEHDLSALKLA